MKYECVKIFIGVYFLLDDERSSMTTGKTLSSQHERDGLTLKEIASMMDLTKERARQIEARALIKLRVNLAAKNITPVDLFGEMP